MGELTPIENSRLSECEAVIQKSISSFYEMGNALKEIRDGKLYRERFETFEQYCESSWALSRPRAYQLIDSKQVMDNLSTVVDKPISERQVRPLTKLDPDQQREAWNKLMKDAEETHEPITAKKVEEVVQRYCAPCKAEAVTFRKVTYLNSFYNKQFEGLVRGGNQAEYIRELIEKHCDDLNKKSA